MLSEFSALLDNSGYDLVYISMSTIGRTLIIVVASSNKNYLGISWVITGYSIATYVIFVSYTILGFIYG